MRSAKRFDFHGWYLICCLFDKKMVFLDGVRNTVQARQLFVLAQYRKAVVSAHLLDRRAVLIFWLLHRWAD